jgi:hypothetical protein
MKIYSYNNLLDPTIPDRDEFIAGGRWDGLADDLDALADGLTGTTEEQRGQFYDKILALAQERDLPFRDVHEMARLRHPEWMESETLEPTPFVPKLKTLTEQREAEAEHQKAIKEAERKKAEKRMGTIRAMQDQDPELTFVSAWEAIEAEELRPATVKKSLPMTTQPEAAMGRATLVACEKSPSGEAWLIEGAMCCPIFPQD